MKRLEVVYNFAKKSAKKDKKDIFEELKRQDAILYKHNPKLMAIKDTATGAALGTLFGHLATGTKKGRLFGAGAGALSGYINTKRARVRYGLDK